MVRGAVFLTLAAPAAASQCNGNILVNGKMQCKWCDSYSKEACGNTSAYSPVNTRYGPNPNADSSQCLNNVCNNQCPACPAWPADSDPRKPSIHDVKDEPEHVIWPCDANPDCKVCHKNGCDQCKDGHFQMSYALPCLKCSIIKGCTGNCNNDQGCSQCGVYQDIMYHRKQCTWQGVSIWMCLRKDASSDTGFESCTQAKENNGWQTETDLPTAAPTKSPVTSLPTTSPSRAPTCELEVNGQHKRLKCDWCQSESNEACTVFKEKYCAEYVCPDGYADAQECPSCPFWLESDRGHMREPDRCDLEGKPTPADWKPAQVAVIPWPCNNNRNCKICHKNGCDQCWDGYFKSEVVIREANGSTSKWETGCVKSGVLADWNKPIVKCQVVQKNGCAQCQKEVQPKACGAVMACKKCDALFKDCDGKGERVWNPSPENDGNAASRAVDVADRPADAKSLGFVAAAAAAGTACLAAVVGAAVFVRRLRNQDATDASSAAACADSADSPMLEAASRSQDKAALSV